jgi:hypothetical protein
MMTRTKALDLLAVSGKTSQVDAAASVYASPLPFQSNVIPERRRAPRASLIDIHRRSLDQAAGGFSAVVELAATFCSRVLDHSLAPPRLQLPISASQLRNWLGGYSESFGSAYLNLLRAHPEIVTNHVLDIEFVPVGLMFEGRNRFTLRYSVVLLLEPVAFVPANASWTIGRHLTGALPHGTVLVSPVVSPGKSLLRLFSGDFDWKLSAEYHIDADATLSRVNVLADLDKSEGTTTFANPDVQKLFEGVAGRHLAGFLASPSNHRGNVKLIPTLSLVGHNPSNLAVTELQDCKVSAFSLGVTPRQALAIAFDVSAGCRGVVEDVKHFIGGADYGVVSDEIVVESLFKFQWRRGGFLRAFTSNAPVKVEAGDAVTDAILHGAVELHTLEKVLIDTDANLRDDFIVIGGAAKITPEHVQMADGRVLSAGEIEGLSFGADDVSWAMVTTPMAHGLPVSDPQMRTFQERAHLDAYQYIAKPFLEPPSAAFDLQHISIDAPDRRVCVIGNIPRSFL